ncbi:MAG: hypothetical protein RMK84_03540 [Oscillochloridaceae bacterium]|nr:hypothetical protein [Chloroflexaceae bacterium]MDW8389178.1 hypothetical protein [Oscillochloridaceae bacterium]
MASKSDFTPEEWQTIGLAPVVTAMYISMADPSGPIGLMKEMFAAVSGIIEGAKDAASLQIVKDLAADLEARAIKPDLPKFSSKEEAKTFAVNTVNQAIALVEGRSPEEGRAFRQFLYDTAQKAAEAGKEGGFLGFGGTAVSDLERQALAELASALGLAA